MARSFPKFGYDPITGEWNDSMKGDYCWSSVNFRKAAPDVMTPITWSLLWIYLECPPDSFSGWAPTGWEDHWTDVGAPLSHAGIVVRELGAPAVVGYGNAIMLLKPGDRVCVDGGRGTVGILSSEGTEVDAP